MLRVNILVAHSDAADWVITITSQSIRVARHTYLCTSIQRDNAMVLGTHCQPVIRLRLDVKYRIRLYRT